MKEKSAEFVISVNEKVRRTIVFSFPHSMGEYHWDTLCLGSGFSLPEHQMIVWNLEINEQTERICWSAVSHPCCCGAGFVVYQRWRGSKQSWVRYAWPVDELWNIYGYFNPKEAIGCKTSALITFRSFENILTLAQVEKVMILKMSWNKSEKCLYYTLK